MTSVDKSVFLGSVAAAMAAAPGAASAQSLLAEAFFRTESVAQQQQAGSYEVERDGARFSLDQSGAAPLIRFDGGPEVFALQVQQGPRGDQFLKTDHGFTVLRITTNQSVIVYGQGYPTGAPAAFMGAAGTIAPPGALRGDLHTRLETLASRMSKTLSRTVTISAPTVSSADSAFFAEAADRAADGVVRARASLPSHGDLVIRFVVAKAPAARFQNDELRVGVNPKLSYGGRPSSLLISQAVTRAQSIRPSEVSFSYSTPTAVR